MRARSSLVTLAVLASLGTLVTLGAAGGCSFSRFNDFKNDTPVFAFANKSFGVHVGVSTNPDGAAFLGTAGNVGEGSRTFALRDGRADPSGDPLSNQAVCLLNSEEVSAGRACLGAQTLVGLGALTDSAGLHPGCFAVGYGKTTDDSTVLPGPVAHCTDGHVFTLGAVSSGPDTTKDTAPALTVAFANRDEAAIRKLSISFATLPIGGGANPALLLGDESDNTAYVYKSISAGAPPTLLLRPSKANGFGRSVALGKGAGGTLFAVGAPGDGEVYVFFGDPAQPDKIVPVGCAGDGVAGSGESIALGDVDGDRIDDLLVAQGSGGARAVQIYLGKDAPTAKVTTECANAWAPSALVLKCEDTRGAGGCANDADFGRSIAIGDLDKDGFAEVAVGAPKASADGNGGAGVVFLYTPSKSSAVADVRYLGKPDGGAGFGTSVAIGAVGTQDTLAVAAPGTGKSYVVWCTNLPGAPTGPRCRK